VSSHRSAERDDLLFILDNFLTSDWNGGWVGSNGRVSDGDWNLGSLSDDG